MSTRNKDGLQMGQEVLKLDQNGKVLMMLGKMGVAGSGTDVFDRPTGVAIGRNGDIFVTDGHQPNTTGNARVMKFSKDGKFIKQWGHLGPAPGDFDEPHDIAIGGSEQRVYVADRKNARIQVFDQDGNFITQWKQFGKPSSVFVGKDDTIYVGSAFRNPGANKLDELRGITVGSARDGALQAFIPDPSDLNQVEWGTSASGLAADSEGSIFAADVGTHGLRKYMKVR
jgi:DNA-binding beta-propeller fold protein YncE